MAQSAGSPRTGSQIQFRFVFTKQDDEIRVTQYRRKESTEWLDIKEDFQVLDHHEALKKRQTVLTAIDVMDKKRQLVLKLKPEEAAPYLDGRFLVEETTIEEDTDFGIPESVGPKQDSTVEALKDMLVTQSQMVQEMMKTFQSIMTQDKNSSSQMQVTDFDGRSEDAKVWLKSYEKACQFNHWTTESSKVNHLKAYLKGSALKWFNSRIADDVAEDWNDWKASFERAFGQNRVQLAIQANQWEYIGGPLMDFYYEKQRLIQLAYPSLDDCNFITIFMLGLPREMQSQLLNLQLKTREEFREALERMKPTVRSQELKSKADYKQFQEKKHFTRGKEQTFNVKKILSKKDLNLVFELVLNGIKTPTLFDTGADVNLVDEGFC